MKVIYLNFFIFVFLKQFYIFKSGGLQPADIFFVISFALYLIKIKKITINNKDIYLAVFVYIGLIINTFYFVIYGKNEFMLSSFHYVYNFMIVILFRQLIQESSFIQKLLKVLKINIFSQLIIYILGLGSYYMETRYIGTFNDPNQLAFFVYITLMLIIILSNLINIRVNIIYYLIVVILIFASSSTGMLLAISSFSVLYIFLNKTKITIKFSISLRKIITSIPIIIILVIFLIPNSKIIINAIQETEMMQRLQHKIDFTSELNESEESLIEERGIDKLFIYPEQMLLGAGQGYYHRFKDASHMGEIHSTLPSILFCYGIIPTILVIVWGYINIKYIPLQMFAIYISLMLESFTLLNQRQPFFWMIFVVGSLYIKDNITRCAS